MANVTTVTINIPVGYKKRIDDLIEKKKFKNISAFFRVALHDFIPRELARYHKMRVKL